MCIPGATGLERGIWHNWPHCVLVAFREGEWCNCRCSGADVLLPVGSAAVRQHKLYLIGQHRSTFPQGSRIGPFGFKLYTKPLTSIAKKHGINIHLYADDTQLYTSFKPEESEAALERLEACIEEIRNWMEANYLKLNDSKTEFIIFGTKIDLAKVSGWTVTVGNSEILPSKSARNIGAFMDSALNMETHINNIIRSCYAQLHSISKIRRYLTIDAAKTIVHAFVLSQLDNLNSLLYDIPVSKTLERLQMVQNNAARLLVKQSRMDLITPTLITLHWLPVKYRIEYKILLLV